MLQSTVLPPDRPIPSCDDDTENSDDEPRLELTIAAGGNVLIADGPEGDTGGIPGPDPDEDLRKPLSFTL